MQPHGSATHGKSCRPPTFAMTELMRLIAILLAMLCHPALSAAAADVPADVARYLAGLPVAAAGPLRDLTAGGVRQDHSRRLGEAWSGFDRRLLSKLRTFAMNQLVDRRHTALYFFSGPDFAYAQALFPEASTYVLAGLSQPTHFQRPTQPSSASSRCRGCERHLKLFLTSGCS